MMKSPSEHAEQPMPDYNNQIVANNMERRPSWQGHPQMHRPPMQQQVAEHDQVPQQRQTFIPEKPDPYGGVPSAYANSPALSQGSNSWQEPPGPLNQHDRFQPSPANSANSQYMDQVENSTNPAVNTNGISGAAAAAAAAMAAAAHSAKGSAGYQPPQPGPAIPPSSNAVPMHPQHRMPHPGHRGITNFHPNYANIQQTNMGPPVQDSYQNNAFGGYQAPPRQAPMVRHMMGPGPGGPGPHYPGHLSQWGPQQPNSPDMRVRYPYDNQPPHPMGERPPYHPYPSTSNPMGMVSNNMVMESEDNKPKVPASARSSSQKISALYEPDEPGRKEFIDRVLQYWEEKELPLKHAPLMGRRTLDLFVLYQHVKKKGFMQEVTRSKEWAEISNAMGLGNTSATGFTLKKQYCKYLYGFECRFERGEQEPQDALARVIEANRKKKQAAEHQQQPKVLEPPLMNRQHPNQDPMQQQHPMHPDMQHHPRPPAGYMTNQPMDPYSQQRGRPMMGGRGMDSPAQMHPNSQMRMNYMPYGGGYRPNETPMPYGNHPQQPHPYAPPHPAYPHRPANGYPPHQGDPGQMSGMPPNIPKHTQPLPPPLQHRPPYGSPYYRGGPQTPQSSMEVPNQNVKPNIPTPPQAQPEPSPTQNEWQKNEAVPPTISTENTETSKTSVNTEVSESPKSQSTSETPATDSKPSSQSNTPVSAVDVKPENAEQNSTSEATNSEPQNPSNSIAPPSEKIPDVSAKVEPIPPARHLTPQPIPTSIPASVNPPPPRKEYSPGLQPLTHGPQNQYGYPGKPEPMQQLGYPPYGHSSQLPPPFPTGSPSLPQEGIRQMLESRPRYDRSMPRGIGPPPPHPYHPQQGEPYRGPPSSMQPGKDNFGQKRHMHPMEMGEPPNKMARSASMARERGTHQRRPPSNELGSHMQSYPPYAPNSMHRVRSSAMPHGWNQSPHHSKQILGAQIPGQRQPMTADGQMYHALKRRQAPASESASKYLQGLCKDQGPEQIQLGHKPHSFIQPHPVGSVTQLLNSPHLYQRRHHHGRPYPSGSVEMTQPLFANAKGKLSQDVGTVEAWQIIMSLKSGLLAESTWALNTLSIMLHDRNTVGQIVLQQLPGLLHSTIEHFRCALREVFNMRKGPRVPWTIENQKFLLTETNENDDTNEDSTLPSTNTECVLQPTKYGKIVPAPSGLRNPFTKLPVKISMESEDCASLREIMWEETEEKSSHDPSHILPCYNGKPVFEHEVTEKEQLYTSQDAENHAAEVTLEDMLSVPSFIRCHKVIDLDKDSGESSTKKEKIVKDATSDSEKMDTNVEKVDVKVEKDESITENTAETNISKDVKNENKESSNGSKKEKASHIQSCLDRFLWRHKIVLLENEAAGFPGNVRHQPSSVEHVFSTKLTEKESEMISRTLCLSNLLRSLSCASTNHTDLCLREDFITILSGTLLLCHKHRIRRFSSQTEEDFFDDINLEDTNDVKSFENTTPCPSDEVIENKSANDNTKSLDNDLANRCRKRTLSVQLHDCLLDDDIRVDAVKNLTVKSKEVIEASKPNAALVNGNGILSNDEDSNSKCNMDDFNEIVAKSKKNNIKNTISENKLSIISKTQQPDIDNDTHKNIENQNDDATNDGSDVSVTSNEKSKIDLEYSSTVLHNSVYDEDECYSDPWWWECVRQIREDSLVTLANLSCSLNLSQFSDINAMHSIIDACLHWAVCSSADAQDPFPSSSIRATPSPQSLGIEILSKLSMKEANADFILATRPYSRLEKLFRKLMAMVGNRKDQMLREFAIVLVSNLCYEPTVSRAIALQPGAISNLLSFLEECEETGLSNQRMFPASQEIINCGTIPYMMQKCALILLKLAKIQDNRVLFLKHNLRLLSLSMSSLLGGSVLSILSSVLFELNSEIPNR